MKTKTALAPRVRLPHQKVAAPLPVGALACLACGVGVRHPQTVEKLHVLGTQRMIEPGLVRIDEREFEISMTRCEVCGERIARAQAIFDAHPRVVRPLGSPSYALSLIDAALGGLDALGVKPARADAFAATDRDLRLLLNRMPSVGAGVRWVNRFVSIMQWDVKPETCAPSRWSHIPEAEGNQLREAYASLLRTRTEQPVPVTPPSGGGCLLCGVGAIVTLPSRASNEGVWSGPWKATPDTLGGRSRPEKVSGYLCPACARVANEVGALGPTALERALIAFLGVARHTFDDVAIRGIRAWAALPPGTPPNSTPWAHEPNLEKLASQLRRV